MTGFDHPDQAPRTLGAVTVALTAAAGALDVVTYFAFNQVFASTMTGNLVLLGLAVGEGQWTQGFENICAILGYCAGLVIGTVACGLMMRRLPWRNAVGSALTVELVVLVLVGVGWYGLDPQDSPLLRATLLVVGSAVAMGIQAGALRYVGPSGTPTNFLSGTVTNWVAGMVELHKPKWDGNSALRILVVAVAAAVGAVVQLNAPSWSYALPVGMVVLAVVLMAVVVRANHGGLTVGEPQFAPDPATAVPDAVPSDEPDGTDTAPAATGSGDPDDAGTVGHVHGRVTGTDGNAQPASVTLVDLQGRQVGRVRTEPDGAYRLQPPEAGDFVMICAPHRMGGHPPRPRAVLVTVDGRSVNHDVVVGASGAI